VWPPEERRPRLGAYTVRQVDPDAGSIDVDFVLHGDPAESVGALGGSGEVWRPCGAAGDLAAPRSPETWSHWIVSSIRFRDRGVLYAAHARRLT